MSTDYPKGGYAFADGEMQHQTPTGYERQLGMTLRDYFAGQALAGMTANGSWCDMLSSGPAVKTNTALAYQYADAMLAEREKGGDA